MRYLGQKKVTTDNFVKFNLQQFPKDAAMSLHSKIFTKESLVSSIVDLHGLLSPLAIRIKLILQQIWQLGKKGQIDITGATQCPPESAKQLLRHVRNSNTRIVYNLSKNQPDNVPFLWMPQWQLWQPLLTSVPVITKTASIKPIFSCESAGLLPLNKMRDKRK